MQQIIFQFPDAQDVEIIDFETRRLEEAGIMHPALGHAYRAMIRDAVAQRDIPMRSYIIDQMDALENGEI